MNNIREKLFYLMANSKNPAWDAFISNKQMLDLVDYLIANGVTIPVRCKDCKYIRPMIDAATGEEDGYYCALNLGEVGFDDFCSCSDRKE